MKKSLFLVVVFCVLSVFTFQASAQVIYRAVPVALTGVPTAVINKFNQDFPAKPLATWEKHTATGTTDDNNKIHFVARFVHETRATRARYRENGEAVSVTTFLGTMIPEEIRSKAAAQYPGFVLTSGDRVRSLVNGKTVYRLRFRVRAAKRIAYFDEQGNVITSANLDPSMTLDENE